MKALISKSAAMKMLEVTGASIRLRKATIAALQTKRDGARDKVFSSDVIAAVSKLSRPQSAGIKPVSDRHLEKLRGDVLDAAIIS